PAGSAAPPATSRSRRSRCCTPSGRWPGSSPCTPARAWSRSSATPTATAGSPRRRPRSTASSTTSTSAAPTRAPTRPDRTRTRESSPMNTFPYFSPSARAEHAGPSSRYILPQFEERTSYGMKRQDPYTKLFEDRIIFLGVQIDDASADDIIAQLIVLESQDPDRDIVMYINSPGGSF